MQSPRDADRPSSAPASSTASLVNHEGKAAGMRQLAASVPIRTAASGAQIGIPILVVSITGDIALGAALGLAEGAGLALVCELLGGALAGGATAHTAEARGDGRRRVLNSMFSILVDPGRMGTAAHLAREMEGFLDWTAASPPRSGFDRVRTPGEPERESKQARMAAGVPVDRATWAEIVAAGGKVGLGADRLAALAGTAG